MLAKGQGTGVRIEDDRGNRRIKHKRGTVYNMLCAHLQVGTISLKSSNNCFPRRYDNTKLNETSAFSHHKIYIASCPGQVTWQKSQRTIRNVHEHLASWFQAGSRSGLLFRRRGDALTRVILINADTSVHRHPRRNCFLVVWAASNGEGFFLLIPTG